MFVRRKLNKSGSISVQVLSKRNGRNVLVRSFGSSRIEAEVCEMERRAHDFINTYGGQTVFDFEAHQQTQRRTQLDNVFSQIVDIRQNAPQIILERIYDGIGYCGIFQGSGQKRPADDGFPYPLRHGAERNRSCNG